MRKMIRWSLTSALLLSVGLWSAGALPEGASYGGDAHVFVFTPRRGWPSTTRLPSWRRWRRRD